MSDRPEHGFPLAFALVAAFAGIGFIVGAATIGAEFAVPVGIVALVAAAVVLRGPLGHALARQLGSASGDADVAQLQEQIDEMRGRLAEVEERLDFAERMLVAGERADRLPGRTEA